MNNQISHEDCMVIINEERNYRELKESIRMMKVQEDKKMLSYCLKCRKNTESINPRVLKTSNCKTMILSKCAICCNSIKARFVKEQEASGILSSVSIRTPLSKIPVLGDIFFYFRFDIK